MALGGIVRRSSVQICLIEFYRPYMVDTALRVAGMVDWAVGVLVEYIPVRAQFPVILYIAQFTAYYEIWI